MMIDICQLDFMRVACQQAEKSLTSKSKGDTKQQPQQRPKRKRELRRQQIREAVEKASRDSEGYEVKMTPDSSKEDFDEQQALKLLKQLMATMNMSPADRKSFVTQGELNAYVCITALPVYAYVTVDTNFETLMHAHNCLEPTACLPSFVRNTAGTSCIVYLLQFPQNRAYLYCRTGWWTACMNASAWH